jgi:hypothetical protein
MFSTRFECTFPSSPLVSSVVCHVLHSFRVYFSIFPTRFECILAGEAASFNDNKGVKDATAEFATNIDDLMTDVNSVKHTRNEWITLEGSKPHSKRVKFFSGHSIKGWLCARCGRCGQRCHRGVRRSAPPLNFPPPLSFIIYQFPPFFFPFILFFRGGQCFDLERGGLGAQHGQKIL